MGARAPKEEAVEEEEEETGEKERRGRLICRKGGREGGIV